jgi:amidase
MTAVPEMCVFGTTDSVFGVTRNPWRPDRTPGGSSGGSAAAVAAGMVPAAHGADGMGSIRIPAACTGIVGVKPGSGVVPAQMGVNDWYGMSENGAFATTVADAAAVLAVLAARPEWADVEEPHEALRIALSYRPPVAGVRLDPAHAAAAGRAATILSGEGHRIERTELGYADTATTKAAIGALARWFAGASIDTQDLDRAALEPRVRVHARLGDFVRRTPLLSERLRAAWQRRAAELLSSHDVLITPALANPPIEARAWSQESWLANVRANVEYAPFAAPWNLAGYPAMVVPIGVHPEAGTPIAVQLVGRPGTETLLLSVAATLERVRPWQRTAPGYLPG